MALAPGSGRGVSERGTPDADGETTTDPNPCWSARQLECSTLGCSKCCSPGATITALYFLRHL